MLQFCREIPLRIIIQETPSSRRGFLFYLAVGFSPISGRVDSLSGMSVDLLAVDRWLQTLKVELEALVLPSSPDTPNQVFADLLATGRSRLTEMAEKEGACPVSLRFREERGWGFYWHSSLPANQQVFLSQHYLELFQRGEAAEVLKVETEWLRFLGCEMDYPYQGLKLLKMAAAGVQDLETLLANLSNVKGRRLGSGTLLTSVRLHVLSAGFSLDV